MFSDAVAMQRATLERCKVGGHFARIRSTMLWTIIAVLIVLWLVATVLKFTIGGLVHLLLIVAVGLLVYRFLTGA